MPLTRYGFLKQARSEFVDLHIAVLGHDRKALMQLRLDQWANLFAANAQERKPPAIAASTAAGSQAPVGSGRATGRRISAWATGVTALQLAENFRAKTAAAQFAVRASLDDDCALGPHSTPAGKPLAHHRGVDADP